MPISPSERSRYVIEERSHTDGSTTVIFRNSTPFSVKKRITDRFNKSGYSATLYSDNRLEATKASQAMMRNR